MKNIPVAPILAMSIILLFSKCNPGPADQSLSTEDYLKMGMPGTTELWTYADYQQCCVALSNLKALKPKSMPRKESNKSESYFNRMIDLRNFAFLADEKLTLKQRAYRIQSYIDIQRCLVTAYTEMNFREQYYNRELIDLYIFWISIAQHMLDLGQQINESMNEDEIEMQNRYLSIQQMYVSMVLLVIENQLQSQFFSQSDLERLSEFIYNSVKINSEWMNDAMTESIKPHLQKVIDATSSELIKKR